MKGTTITVRGFELRDATAIGFWTCERDGYEVSCALSDDLSTQPDGKPYFARVAVDGADFGSADGASVDEAVELAFRRADLGMERIAARRARQSRTAREFHEELVRLACEAFTKAPSGNGAAFERLVRERMAQAAQVYALDVGPGVEPHRVDSDVSPKSADVFRDAMTRDEAGPWFVSSEWEGRSSLAEMLRANSDSEDTEFRAWLREAKPGDVWRDIVTVECVR